MRDVTFQDYIRNLQTVIVPALIVEDDTTKRSTESVTDVHDEKDIVSFIRAYAERPTMAIVNKFAATHELLQGTELQFRNNAYGLHPKLVQGDEKSLPPPNKKRSPDRPTSLAPDR
ncbi:hypothetical protein B0T26DRAFT_756641 [Lasiosphaeria miniovina]|uniref:Uncharacterized protein n=1 Tax=Lasiosphaeria miniovina TaxID=1954250 RepID=A0AA39ZT02_9PEZI|nr:uncharacterized protein B0T26DRAFT_756641 [Lasiosphaeria miniovina]KAK0703063.1 hypothetical protein B0T26DRAFT_756641 [Lasiosphaeria miniovina]